jgi:hypothetical protein
MSALASVLLLGSMMSPPAATACAKTCALGPAPAAQAKKAVRRTAEADKASKGNIGDYWSPCNSNKLTDYMYCQP